MPLRDEAPRSAPAWRPDRALPPAPNGREKTYLLPAQRFGTVRVRARSLDAAIEAYDAGVVADFDWQEDPGDDPELIRPAVAAVEGTEEILQESL